MSTVEGGREQEENKLCGLRSLESNIVLKRVCVCECWTHSDAKEQRQR